MADDFGEKRPEKGLWVVMSWWDCRVLGAQFSVLQKEKTLNVFSESDFISISWDASLAPGTKTLYNSDLNQIEADCSLI